VASGIHARPLKLYGQSAAPRDRDSFGRDAVRDPLSVQPFGHQPFWRGRVGWSKTMSRSTTNGGSPAWDRQECPQRRACTLSTFTNPVPTSRPNCKAGKPTPEDQRPPMKSAKCDFGTATLRQFANDSSPLYVAAMATVKDPAANGAVVYTTTLLQASCPQLRVSLVRLRVVAS